jgi:hypothetical protein
MISMINMIISDGILVQYPANLFLCIDDLSHTGITQGVQNPQKSRRATKKSHSNTLTYTTEEKSCVTNKNILSFK